MSSDDGFALVVADFLEELPFPEAQFVMQVLRGANSVELRKRAEDKRHFDRLMRNPANANQRDFVCVGGPADGHRVLSNDRPWHEIVVAPDFPTFNFESPVREMEIRRGYYKLESLVANETRFNWYIDQNTPVEDAIGLLLSRYPSAQQRRRDHQCVECGERLGSGDRRCRKCNTAR